MCTCACMYTPAHTYEKNKYVYIGHVVLFIFIFLKASKVSIIHSVR